MLEREGTEKKMEKEELALFSVLEEVGDGGVGLHRFPYEERSIPVHLSNIRAGGTARDF